MSDAINRNPKPDDLLCFSQLNKNIGMVFAEHFLREKKQSESCCFDQTADCASEVWQEASLCSLTLLPKKSGYRVLLLTNTQTVIYIIA